MSQDNFCRLESFRWLFCLTWKLLANLDLLQVDLTSFLASGVSFLGRVVANRATKSREVILNRTKDFFESL